jgi:hypothetical protein
MEYLQHHLKWRYKNIGLAVVGILIAVILSQIPAFHAFLMALGKIGYIGSFLAGMMFVSIFTVPTSILLLHDMASYIPAWQIGLIAGAGAMAGDLIIFRFVKDGLMDELEDIYRQVDRRKRLVKMFHTKYFSWMLPIFGAFLIASPFPDELGVTLMGASKMDNRLFMLISYLLNSAGIFAMVSVSLLI